MLCCVSSVGLLNLSVPLLVSHRRELRNLSLSVNTVSQCLAHGRHEARVAPYVTDLTLS